MSALFLIKTAEQNTQQQGLTPAQAAAMAGGTGAAGAGGMYLYHRNKFGKLKKERDSIYSAMQQAGDELGRARKENLRLQQERDAFHNAMQQAGDQLGRTQKELEEMARYKSIASEGDNLIHKLFMYAKSKYPNLSMSEFYSMVKGL